MSKVNFSEYNEVHLPRADHLVSFVKNLPHAVQKSGDKPVQAEVMHQLKCIGFGEDFIKEMCQVAHDYKEYHKERIKAEQTKDLPEVRWPTISGERIQQYAANRDLISAITTNKRSARFFCEIAEAIEEELKDRAQVTASGEDINLMLLAYLARDVDAMFTALVGWNFEDILAKAKIIPDEKGYFYKAGDFPLSEVAFPLYRKSELTVDEFKTHLYVIHGISDDTWKMVQSVINFVKTSSQDAQQRTDLLWAVLKDYGIPEEIVRMVKL